MDQKPPPSETFKQALGPLPGLEEVVALFEELEQARDKHQPASEKEAEDQAFEELLAFFETGQKAPPSSPSPLSNVLDTEIDLVSIQKRNISPKTIIPSSNFKMEDLTNFQDEQENLALTSTIRQNAFGPIPNFLSNTPSDPAAREDQKIAEALIRDGSPFAPRYLEAHPLHDSFRDPLRAAKPPLSSTSSLSPHSRDLSFQRRSFNWDFSKSRINVTMSRMSFGGFLASLLGLGFLFFGAGFLVAALLLAKKDPIGVEASLSLSHEHTLPLPFEPEPSLPASQPPVSLPNPSPFPPPLNPPLVSSLQSAPVSPSLEPHSYSPPSPYLTENTAPAPQVPPSGVSSSYNNQPPPANPQASLGSGIQPSPPPVVPPPHPLAPSTGQPSLGQAYASDMSAIEQAIRSLNAEVEHLPKALGEPPSKKDSASGSPPSPAPKKPGSRGKKRKGTHAIQLGTFSRLETATRGIKELPQKVKHTHKPRVVRIAGKKGPLYAIQLGPFESAPTAKKALGTLPSWMKRWGPTVVSIKTTDVPLSKNA